MATIPLTFCVRIRAQHTSAPAGLGGAGCGAIGMRVVAIAVKRPASGAVKSEQLATRRRVAAAPSTVQGTAVDSKFDLWWGPLLQHLHRPVAIAGAVVDSSAVFSARACSQKTATVDPRVCLGVNLRGAIRAYLHVESLGDI